MTNSINLRIACFFVLPVIAFALNKSLSEYTNECPIGSSKICPKEKPICKDGECLPNEENLSSSLKWIFLFVALLIVFDIILVILIYFCIKKNVKKVKKQNNDKQENSEIFKISGLDPKKVLSRGKRGKRRTSSKKSKKDKSKKLGNEEKISNKSDKAVNKSRKELSERVLNN